MAERKPARRLQGGWISPAEFKWIEDRAIDEAIAQQEACWGATSSRMENCGARRFLVRSRMPSRAMGRSTSELALSRNGRPRRASTKHRPRMVTILGEASSAQIDRRGGVYLLRSRARCPVKVTLPSPADDGATVVTEALASEAYS